MSEVGKASSPSQLQQLKLHAAILSTSKKQMLKDIRGEVGLYNMFVVEERENLVEKFVTTVCENLATQSQSFSSEDLGLLRHMLLEIVMKKDTSIS